jgi:glycosyltransferase involved in cell wall biosynthesis
LGRLRTRAGDRVTFLGALSNDAIREEYQRAAVTLLPGEEDFGIVPVEAQACGRPVVAYGRGGALETVKNGETGVLVTEETPEAFAAGIRRALSEPFEVPVIRAHAESFGRARFAREMQVLIGHILSAPVDQTTW